MRRKEVGTVQGVSAAVEDEGEVVSMRYFVST